MEFVAVSTTDEMVGAGLEEMLVVIGAPVICPVSFELICPLSFVMRVPLARGLATRTTNWTEPEVPALRVPMLQETTPLAGVPPPVDEKKVVFAGTVSETTTPVALALPVLAKEIV